jgi:hypothetical protein
VMVQEQSAWLYSSSTLSNYNVITWSSHLGE